MSRCCHDGYLKSDFVFQSSKRQNYNQVLFFAVASEHLGCSEVPFLLWHLSSLADTDSHVDKAFLIAINILKSHTIR